MKVIIDGAEADVKFEKEKTLGEALSSIENWINESGFCLSRVSVNGTDADTGNLFSNNIDDIKSLDIVTRPLAVLYSEALSELIKTLDAWRNETGRREAIEAEYKESPSYSFLADYDKRLFIILYDGNLSRYFSDESVKKTLEAARQRLSEAENPAAAFLDMESDLDEEVGRLQDLQLDLQTGNDKRAAQTVEKFSDITQKIIRLFPLLKYAMIKKTDKVLILFDEFKPALEEFLTAYENEDMVLSGDLAEYEIAPRIKEIYAALKESLFVRE
ncbi:MAG: hypothetical protein LBC27_00425 [Spirochaetaceae bacterium]|jgi:hypothetical protein|nr:hypothetical protein [Spirochaetaceae bacterium]